MMELRQPISVFALGDTAATVEFGNIVDRDINMSARILRHWIVNHPFNGLLDVMSSYSSVTVFYDAVAVWNYYRPAHGAFAFVKDRLLELVREARPMETDEHERLLRVPVCYDEEFAIDMDHVVAEKHLSRQEVIDLHTSKMYEVYMVGFLPGFAYMAEVDARLVLPRKNVPANVPKGSVGIASNQTGIYPVDCPGGWQIIGRTPVRLFDPALEVPVPFQTGDKVEFYQISKQEFYNFHGAIETSETASALPQGHHG